MMKAIDVPYRYRKGIRGTARMVDTQPESQGERDNKIRLNFRLERVDSEGNVEEEIQVEVLARKISGRIVEGDTVIVLGDRNRRGVLSPNSIFNYTTNSQIKIWKHFGIGNLFLMIFLFPINLLAPIGIIIGLIMIFSKSPIGIPLFIGSLTVFSISLFISKKRGM